MKKKESENIFEKNYIFNLKKSEISGKKRKIFEKSAISKNFG